jgi:hypothetical protein
VILLAVLIIAIATVPLAGGRLGALAEIEPKWAWAIVVAIGLQILIISIFPDRFEALHEPVHILSYGFAAVFLIRNLRLPGVPLIGLGALANFTAIVANGGVMPASITAQRAAGIAQETSGFVNSGVVEDPKLLFLGDVFAIPESWPVLNNVFSVGDILIAFGALLLIHGVCGSRIVPGWAGGTSSPSRA